MNQIAERLVQLRKESGLSQEQLAERLYVSRQAVGKWERAEGLPDIENLLLLSRLYGVSMDSLLNLDQTSEELDAAKLAENSRAKKKKALIEFFKISVAAVLGIAIGFFAFGIIIKSNDAQVEQGSYEDKVTFQGDETYYVVTIVDSEGGWVELQDGEICYIITYAQNGEETSQDSEIEFTIMYTQNDK